MGGKNSGKAVGGSTVHFAMVSLRFRPEWFDPARPSAMARTGRSIGARCGGITRSAERALSISGPLTYPWGPKRPRYPYRAHEFNAAADAAGARRGGDGYRLDRNTARDRVRPHGVAAVRLSRLLPLRLLDQRQAKPLHLIPRALRPALKSAISPWSAASRPIRTDGDRRALPPRQDHGAFSAPAMSSSPATRSRRRGFAGLGE